MLIPGLGGCSVCKLQRTDGQIEAECRVLAIVFLNRTGWNVRSLMSWDCTRVAMAGSLLL